MELNDRVAIVTGGSGGIGRAMAAAFLDQGARAVVLADLNEAAVSAAAGEHRMDLIY
ncbi:MAG: SDR family NAD(P)-dependent oxidoreductase, partial [Actinomycetota bacterium]|nr:SDR family NAD(P)-dependent oxidoreductase [Actinomycetota bacterium]